MSEEPKLLPCPFCGCRDIHIIGNGIGDYFVTCGDGEETGCGAHSDQRRCESKEHAAERWNRRADPGQWRVPEYDKELDLASERIAELHSLARQMMAAMGLSRRERRRIAAENQFRRVMGEKGQP